MARCPALSLSFGISIPAADSSGNLQCRLKSPVPVVRFARDCTRAFHSFQNLFSFYIFSALPSFCHMVFIALHRNFLHGSYVQSKRPPCRRNIPARRALHNLLFRFPGTVILIPQLPYSHRRTILLSGGPWCSGSKIPSRPSHTRWARWHGSWWLPPRSA